MIQDIFPHIYHNEYLPGKPEENSRILFYEEDQILLKKDGNQIHFSTVSDLEEEGDFYRRCIYLFSIDEICYFLSSQKPALKKGKAAGYGMESIGLFRSSEPQYESFAGITGYQLYQWYRDNRFCGRCGGPMERAERERMLFCPACKKTVYPKISPAVIVGVLDGDRILMTKYSGRTYKRYALIAGFNEIGETIEETVRREVMEEVGVKVKNIRYYKSQPWSFSDTLLMGFYCDLDGSDAIHLDYQELSVGEWLHRDEIPETDPRLSLTNEMILRFKSGKERSEKEKDERETEG